MTTGTAQAPGATAVLQQAADALYASARRHKRAEADHRRAARDAMQQLEALRRTCSTLGIRLVVTTRSQSGDIDPR